MPRPSDISRLRTFPDNRAVPPVQADGTGTGSR